MASASPDLYGYLLARRALPLWLVLVSRTTEGMRLSSPEWLVTYQDGIPANGFNPSRTNCDRCKVTPMPFTLSRAGWTIVRSQSKICKNSR